MPEVRASEDEAAVTFPAVRVRPPVRTGDLSDEHREHRQAAAAVLDRDFDGEVPDDLDALLALPGVGDYTARAVAAFAFGRRCAVVDTNVRRVPARAVRGVDEHGPATARDRSEVDALLPAEPRRAAAVSAALMELGALHRHRPGL